jgi:serine/threonine protein kinase
MLITQNGISVQLATKPFASGGEGEVYHIISPKHCSHQIVKIFKPSKRTPEREQKMKYMRSNPPAHLSDSSNAIVWVKELVYENDQFVGYIMDMAQGVKLEYLCGSKISKSIGKEFQKYDFKYKEAHFWRLKLAFNLAVAAVQIHKTDRYVIVDLKPDNIIVQPNGKVALIDMDSIEIIDNQKVIHPASAHSSEFAPWESAQNGFIIGKDLIPETWDRFGLAVILYKLLFGIHPFTGTCKAPFEHCNNVEQLIQHGLFPFLRGEHFEVVPPPHKRFLQADLEIQALFKQCFDKEIPPEGRPTALMWCECLLPYARMVLNTPKIEEEKPKKKEINHIANIENKQVRKKNWLGLQAKKPKQVMPFQSAQVSWWYKFTRVQDRITPEFIMMFLMVMIGIGGTSANYVSKALQERERIENQRQYEIFVKEGQLLLDAQQINKAIHAYTTALKFKPDDQFADLRCRTLKKQVFVKSAKQFYDLKQYAEAVSEYDLALHEVHNDSTALAGRADAVFADAIANGDIASHFDIKLKIRKLPNYLYTNCANEIFINAYDLGQHFEPTYEVKGAKLIQKDKKGRITLIPTSNKVVFKFKNKGAEIQSFEFEAVSAPPPTISVSSLWRGSFESPFLKISATAPTNFSAYYRDDAIYKVSKWKLSILRNDKPISNTIYTSNLVSMKEINKKTKEMDKWQIDILEVQRRNYQGDYEVVDLKSLKTTFIYNQYFDEIW